MDGQYSNIPSKKFNSFRACVEKATCWEWQQYLLKNNLSLGVFMEVFLDFSN